MDIFSGAGNNITLLEVALLILMGTLANLMDRPKLGLVINLLFTVYWVFFLNYDFAFGAFRYSDCSVFYFGFALIILILAVVGLTRDDDKEY
jgi:lipoprotein signal peptidase